MPQQHERSGPEGGRRMDLSMAQVAAAALAAVVGAVLASSLGVYGTVAGAAVVSVGATTGGAVFQHLFRSTAERLRGAGGRTGAGRTTPAPDAPPDGWNESGVLRARGRRAGRRRSRTRLLAVTGLVFVLAMVPIVAVEAFAGKPMHDITTGGSGTGTSFNPGHGGSGPVRPAAPGPTTAPAGASGGTPSPAPSGHPPSTAPSAEASTPAPSASATAGGSPAASRSAEPGAASGSPAAPTPEAAAPSETAAG